MYTSLPLPSRNYVQICWIVPDLQKGMEHWGRQAGVGPFFYFDHVVYEDAYYRGKPWKPVRFHAGIAQAGGLQIELVSQLEEGPSMFTELAPDNGPRLHHMSTYTEDFEADLQHYLDAGVEIVFTAKMKGTQVCWLDTVQTLGFMTELMTANPIKEQIFAKFREEADNWDGKELTRTLG